MKVLHVDVPEIALAFIVVHKVTFLTYPGRSLIGARELAGEVSWPVLVPVSLSILLPAIALLRSPTMAAAT